MSGIECAICTESYGPADIAVSIGCGHIFHFNCLEECRKKSPNCPLCNTLIVTADLRRVYLDTTNEQTNNRQEVLMLVDSILSEQERMKQAGIEANKTDNRVTIFQSLDSFAKWLVVISIIFLVLLIVLFIISTLKSKMILRRT